MRSAIGTRFAVVCTAAAAIAGILGLAPAAASAATITPNIFTDEVTNNAGCSLREAVLIAIANVNGTEPDCPISGTLGADTISLGAGTYVLDVAGTGNTSAASGDLDINTGLGDVTIDGAGAAATTIDTEDSPVAWDDRVLEQAGASGTLTVSDLTITGGTAGGDEDGGGILSAGGALVVQRARVTGNNGENGGGISAVGSSLAILDSSIDTNTNLQNTGGGVEVSSTSGSIPATIDSSVISGNVTDGSGGGLKARSATLTVTDSVIAGNHAEEVGGSSEGGGISVTEATAASSVTIRGTTISGNEVVGGTSTEGAGVHLGAGTLTLINSTVSDNEAGLPGGSAGGILVTGGTLNLVHTTVGPNPSEEPPSAISETGAGTVNLRGSVIESPAGLLACGGTIISEGFNFLTDVSCAPPATGDEVSTDPVLGPLADNGGPDAGAPGFLQPILTHAPAATSTVIDHVPAADCDDELGAPLLVDQLGAPRPQDGDDAGAVADCDAGSVELAATPATQPPVTTPATPQPAAPKKCKKGRKLKKGKCVKKKRKKTKK